MLKDQGSKITSSHIQFDVWTLSLPLMVTVHGSQDCDAQGAILWQRAFANVVSIGYGSLLIKECEKNKEDGGKNNRFRIAAVRRTSWCSRLGPISRRYVIDLYFQLANFTIV